MSQIITYQHWLEPDRDEEPAPAPPSASEELGQSLLQLMAAQVMLRTKMGEQWVQCIVLLLLMLLLMVLSSPSADGRARDVRDDYDIHDDVDD